MLEQVPTQKPERKTLKDYIVKTFPCNPEITVVPLTVMRSGRDGEGARLDGGWIPGEMLYVCDTDSEEGVGEGALILQVHKPVKIEREGRIYYDVLTKDVSLEKIQKEKANVHFTSDYIHVLFGATPEEMIAEGQSKAEEAWARKHPVNKWETLSTTETWLDRKDVSELDSFPERIRELMKPLKSDIDGVPFEDKYTPGNYDFLFDPSYVPPADVEVAAVRNPEGVPVSENSIKAAEEIINSLTANFSLMQIIDPERTFDIKGIMNRIRGDHTIRCRLFKYFSSRLDRLADIKPEALADRVRRNSGDNLKSPNYTQDYYEGNMRSREYVVILAVAMMDGSFNVDRQDKVVVTHHREGKERNGMHRDAARVLLEYVRNNY